MLYNEASFKSLLRMSAVIHGGVKCDSSLSEDRRLNTYTILDASDSHIVGRRAGIGLLDCRPIRNSRASGCWSHGYRHMEPIFLVVGCSTFVTPKHSSAFTPRV